MTNCILVLMQRNLQKKMNELDDEDNPDNVFRGNAVGLYVDNKRNLSKRNNSKLKPEQTEGEFIVSGYSTLSIVRQNPSDLNRDGTQQIICD